MHILFQMYREHKRAELRQDMKMLETYILTAAAGGPAADLYFFGKVLSFDPLNEGSSDALLPLILLKNLVEKFGLDCFIQRQLRLPTPPSIKSSAILSAVMQLDDVGSLLFVDPSAVASLRGAKKKKLKGNGVAEYSKLDVETSPISVDSVLNRDSSLDASDAESILRNIGFRLRSYLTAEGKIDFSAVFSDQSDLRSGALPLRLEICSGGGEWAAQQVAVYYVMFEISLTS